MATNGVNGATPKTAADFKPEELQNANQEKIRNTIFELDEAINADVQLMEADGEISSDADASGKSEMDRIYDWVNVIDNMLGNMSEQIKKSCTEGVQKLKNMIANLIDMTGMGRYSGTNVEYDGEEVTVFEPNEQASLEPQSTDADVAQGVRVLNRMYWRADQADIQSVYETLTNPVGRYAGIYSKPQAQIGALMGFIGEYGKRLDREQIAIVRRSIQNLNEISKQQTQEELASLPPSSLAAHAEQGKTPDVDKVKAYWNAVRTAGFSHDLKSELVVLGYSEKDARKIAG